MTDQDLAQQLLKWAQKSTSENTAETLQEMAALIKCHREQYAEKKFTEGLNDFEKGMIGKMEAYQKEVAANPKKELYSQFLKLNVEYWKTNPFQKPVINHDN
ncbi:MAG: hypothetical protein WAQ28_02035 [Bacteroidia bacterium]